MANPKLLKVGAVASSCAVIGAGAGVLGNAFASSPGALAPAAATAPSGPAGKAGHRHHKGKHHKGGLLRRVVHADVVVPAKGGKFANATIDRGTVTAVSGDRLTLREGTPKATYKTVTLTIPANARVRDDKHPAKLADVKPGQRAMVVQAPKRTVVAAHDVKHRR